MLAAHQSQRRLLDHQLAPAALIQVTLDPFVTTGSFLICAFAFGDPIEGPYLILALIVFSLTFPGTVPTGPSLRALAGDVLINWLVIVTLLLLIGWATRTLDSFNLHVILAWVLATPAALFATHLLMTVVLPRLLAAQGLPRVAGIAVGTQPPRN